MQIVFNKYENEYYFYDGNKRFTLWRKNNEWFCSCKKTDCEHLTAVKTWIENGGENGTFR